MKKIWFTLALIAIVTAMHAGGMEMTSARLYKKQGEWLKSLQFYDTELQKNPTNGEAYFERGELLGEIAMDPGKSDLAKEIAGDAPNPQRALLERMLSDFEKAKANADDKLTKRITNMIVEMTDAAWTSTYLAAIRNDSLYASATDAGVSPDSAAGRLEEGLGQLELAMIIAPARWESYVLKAHMMDRLGRREQATAVWLEAINRMRAAGTPKDKEELEFYQKNLEIVEAEVLHHYYDSGQFRKVVETANQLLVKDPANLSALQMRAFSLTNLAADTTLTAAERADAQSAAITALQKLKEMGAEDPNVIYFIGQFNLQRGDTAAAISSFEEFVKCAPQDREGLFNLGLLYLEGGSFVNTAKARDAFKTLKELYPDVGAFWHNYGIALIRLNDTAGGKAAIERGKSLGGG